MLMTPRVDAYLARIGIDEPVALDVDGLERLQRAHLTRVPFENLHVFARRKVRTDVDWSVPKIVERGRGGWCYELNGAFAWLLGELGFRVKQLGATVLLERSDPMARGHLALEVTLERPYLVDVGFGDSFIRPLPLDDPGPHDGGSGPFRFEFGEETAVIFDGPDGPQPQYRFGTRAYSADDFVEQSDHKWSDPQQKWRQKPFATRLLDGGPDRVTLLHDRLKLRQNGEWSERPVEPGEEWERLLREWFDMTP